MHTRSFLASTLRLMKKANDTRIQKVAGPRLGVLFSKYEKRLDDIKAYFVCLSYSPSLFH